MNDDTCESDDAYTITNKEAWDYFLNGPKDIFTCESCGTQAYRGNPPDAPGAFYAEVDSEPAIICNKCDENFEWMAIEAQIREGRRSTHRSPFDNLLAHLGRVGRPVSSRFPVPLSVHEVAPDQRASLVPETSVFVGRVEAIIGLTAAVLAGVNIFAAITGALFVSSATGVLWFSITANVFRELALFLVARPELVLGAIGLGYLPHLVEYQSHIADLNLDVGRSRPRWHYLTVFAGGGLVGWFVWVLSQLDILAPVFLPAGVLAWSAGVFTLVYFMHETLLEDRWSYGLRIHTAVWKFPVQYAVGLMLYDGVIGLPGPESTTFAVGLVPPLVGLLYAGRRYLAFTARAAGVGRRVR